MEKVTTFGPVEDNAREQLDRCLAADGEEARGVLCADHHKGYSMPIGGVVASQTHVMPAGVGYDIACGNCAVKLDVQAKDIDVEDVMAEVWRVISFGVGRKNSEPVAHPVIEEIADSSVPFQRGLAQMAQQQLGTVGSGNHYVDLFEDRGDGSLWVGVHFGSRGFGHKTATHFLEAAAIAYGPGKYVDNMDAPPVMIPQDSAMAEDYLYAMMIAGNYAYAGRQWVCDRIAYGILQANVVDIVHNHHNYAWREKHGGEWFLVTRKGATPAFPGQRGFIGSSMGDDSVIVRGVESAASASALYSTVHGAGRVMGRREAAGKTKRVKVQRTKPNGETYDFWDTQVVKPGRVNYGKWLDLLRSMGIVIYGGGADEAPECYKFLPDVLKHHEGTIEIEHRLKVIGVAMAGSDTHDPYKD